MNERVRTAEQRNEIVGRDVGLHPLGLLNIERRAPAGNAQNRLDVVVLRKRANEACAQIARSTDDDDAHANAATRRHGAKTQKPLPLLGPSESDTPGLASRPF